jgi:hypothetical protein
MFGVNKEMQRSEEDVAGAAVEQAAQMANEMRIVDETVNKTEQDVQIILERIEKLQNGQESIDLRSDVAVDNLFLPEVIKKTTLEQKERIFNAVQAMLVYVDKHKFKRTKISKSECIQGICSGSGKPTHHRTVIERDRAVSKRVDCNSAKFRIGPDNVRFTLDHVSKCIELSDQEMKQVSNTSRVPKEVEHEVIQDLTRSCALASI